MRRTMVAAVVLLTACTDSPTAPVARRNVEPITCGEGACAPMESPVGLTYADAEQLANPQTIRVIPARLFDQLEVMAHEMLADPATSDYDRQRAADVLARLPDLRARTTGERSTVTRSSSNDIRISTGDPQSFIELQVYVPGDVISRLTQRLGNTPSCRKEAWEWGISAVTFGSAMIGTAVSAEQVLATRGADPNAWRTFGTSSAILVGSAGTMWFAADELGKCLYFNGGSQ